MIEKHFDIPLVASLALREKQIQQVYRPIIQVHKWFARRPGTLFRALLLAELRDEPLISTYFEPQDFAGVCIADPFMGGGTPLIEANRAGCDVIGFDINPMAAWIVREEIQHIDLVAYRDAATQLLEALRADLKELYVTSCAHYGTEEEVPVKYFLWVKTADCGACGERVDLFPHYRVAEAKRHPQHVLVCSACGDLNEVPDVENPGACANCSVELRLKGPAKRNKCECPKCGAVIRYPSQSDGPPRHRLFAIEYLNPAEKGEHRGRFFKKPDANDLRKAALAEDLWAASDAGLVPTDEILPGDESDRLHRWGYRRYDQLFNARQLLGLQKSAALIASVECQRIRSALATNLSDLLRYQNMLCRYDTMALKSLDIFSVHGFPVGLIQCESNLLGIISASGTNVGSGGWTNIIEKYIKAKRYCDEPFEVTHRGGRKVRLPIPGEWIGEEREGSRPRAVSINCASSTEVVLPDGSLDAVLTDPPYFGNVQYAELMDFCFVWLRKLVPEGTQGFDRCSTRAADELTVNATERRDELHFTEGLAAVYRRMAQALRPGAPLAFTYHHNKLGAYAPIAVAILDAGLVCTASLPCPAEMGGSIHIHGTGSSIVDTIFVNRVSGELLPEAQFSTTEELIVVLSRELGQLVLGGLRPTSGDIRCMAFGHVTRMAIWRLRETWEADRSTADKLAAFLNEASSLADIAKVIVNLMAKPQSPPDEDQFSFSGPGALNAI